MWPYYTFTKQTVLIKSQKSFIRILYKRVITFNYDFYGIHCFYFYFEFQMFVKKKKKIDPSNLNEMLDTHRTRCFELVGWKMFSS